MDISVFDIILLSVEVLSGIAVLIFAVGHAVLDDYDPRIKYNYVAAIFSFIIYTGAFYYSLALHRFNKLHKAPALLQPSQVAIGAFIAYILASAFLYFKRKDPVFLLHGAIGLLFLIILALTSRFFPSPPWAANT